MKRRDILVYISAPVLHDPVPAAEALLAAGVSVVAEQFGSDESNLVVMRRCDAVLRLPGESKGADLEVAEATRLGLPVFHHLDELIGWARTVAPDPRPDLLRGYVPKGRAEDVDHGVTQA